MNHKRIARLLKLLQILQSGSNQDAEGLAQACGVSRRTVFRDMEILRQSGVPVEFDVDSDRYHIPSVYFLPPTNLTVEEALSIIALTGQNGDGPLPFTAPARQAALKLERNFPKDLRVKVRSLSPAIQINISKISPLEGKEKIYRQLVDALAKRHVVRIEYESLTEWETIGTKLRPYQLLFSGRSWYVIGRSSIHLDTRIFNLNRIKSLKPLNEKYAVPYNFSLENHLGNAWHLVPGAGPDHQVVIRFQPLVARNVSEVLWHKTQQLKWHRDGSLEFQVQVSGLQEIAWWILGYGDQAEVIKPAKLRKIVAQRAANMHKIYS